MKKMIGIFLFSLCLVFQAFGQENNLQETIVQDSLPQEILVEKAVVQDSISQKTLTEKVTVQDSIPERTLVEKTVVQDSISQKILAGKVIVKDPMPQKVLAEKVIEEATIIKDCQIAIDTLDEFDTTRMIATLPIKIGYLTPTKNLSENLDGATYTDEAKAIFSYAESEDRIRSFFLTLVVVEHQFLKIDSDFNVLLKLDNGKIISLYNVPDKAELNRDIIMWQYQHTCVVPLEAYYTLKEFKIEKIRINYENYKKTIVLEPDQQQEMFEAILCVEERLKNDVVNP